jgi:hypothetical protein
VSDDSVNPLVGKLVVQSGGKAVSAHTIIGDVILQQDAIRAATRKTWRPLSRFVYPSQNLAHDLKTNYPGHLIAQLHETFQDSGYTTFSGMISIAPQTSISGTAFSPITLISNQPKYLGAIQASVAQMWNENLDRKALQEELNSQLRDLHQNWAVRVNIHSIEELIAYEFIYDPDRRVITILPYDAVSGAPSEYPYKVSCTRELLMLLVAVSRSTILNSGNLETVLSSYPLSKLFLDILDDKTFDMDRIRVNSSDLEEWDYVNPSADEEFKQYGVA